MKRLYIFVEGDNDRELLETLFQLTELHNTYHISFYQYAQKTPKDVSKFIQIIKKMEAKFVFLADLDFEVCITQKKEKIIKKYRVLSTENIQIAKTEIEGWYLAGLDRKASEEMGVKYLPNTDSLTKEKFYSFKPKGYISKIDFLQEIRKRFSTKVASRKNTSFRYFMEKHILDLLV